MGDQFHFRLRRVPAAATRIPTEEDSSSMAEGIWNTSRFALPNNICGLCEEKSEATLGTPAGDEFHFRLLRVPVAATRIRTEEKSFGMGVGV